MELYNMLAVGDAPNTAIHLRYMGMSVCAFLLFGVTDHYKSYCNIKREKSLRTGNVIIPLQRSVTFKLDTRSMAKSSRTLCRVRIVNNKYRLGEIDVQIGSSNPS